jgi:hypothetical protein
MTVLSEFVGAAVGVLKIFGRTIIGDLSAFGRGMTLSRDWTRPPQHDGDNVSLRPAMLR